MDDLVVQCNFGGYLFFSFSLALSPLFTISMKRKKKTNIGSVSVLIDSRTVTLHRYFFIFIINIIIIIIIFVFITSLTKKISDKIYATESPTSCSYEKEISVCSFKLLIFYSAVTRTPSHLFFCTLIKNPPKLERTSLFSVLTS